MKGWSSVMGSRAAVGGAAALALSLLLGCGGNGKTAKDPSDDVSSEDGGGEAAPEVGRQAPKVTGEALGGDGPKTLADGRGQVVVVDFWATWCDPCRKSFPKYQDLVDKYAGKLAVIAVSVDDPEDVKADEVMKFAEDLNVTFAIVWDKDHKTAERYKPPKMPTSYILDYDGVIRNIHLGFEGGDEDKIDKEVEALVK